MSSKGRPKLGEKAKAATIRFRVTPKEQDKLDKAASKRDMALSSWAREILLAAASKAK